MLPNELCSSYSGNTIPGIHGKMKNGLVEEIISDSGQHRIYTR